MSAWAPLTTTPLTAATGVTLVVTGAFSITTWAFVPLKPKELTPAHGLVAGQSVSVVGTVTGRLAQSIWGFGS